MMYGALFVMTCGDLKKLVYPAINWASLLVVTIVNRAMFVY